MHQLATMQILDTACSFVEYWETEDLCIPTNQASLNQRKLDGFRTDKKATVFHSLFMHQKIFTSVNKNWWVQYIRPHFAIVHDCFIGEFDQDY